MGGVPTYALTDNEKTVTVEHVAGIAVRNATIVEVSRHYGLSIQTCEPADPQIEGVGFIVHLVGMVRWICGCGAASLGGL